MKINKVGSNQFFTGGVKTQKKEEIKDQVILGKTRETPDFLKTDLQAMKHATEADFKALIGFGALVAGTVMTLAEGSLIGMAMMVGGIALIGS